MNIRRSGDQQLASIAVFSDDSFTIFYDSMNEDNYFINTFFQRFDASGVPIGTEQKLVDDNLREDPTAYVTADDHVLLLVYGHQYKAHLKLLTKEGNQIEEQTLNDPINDGLYSSYTGLGETQAASNNANHAYPHRRGNTGALAMLTNNSFIVVLPLTDGTAALDNYGLYARQGKI